MRGLESWAEALSQCFRPEHFAGSGSRRCPMGGWVGACGEQPRKPRSQDQGALHAWEAADRRGGTPATALRGEGGTASLEGSGR